MAGEDVVVRVKVRGTETGGEAEAAVGVLTPQTVVVKIDPSTAWDRDALHELSLALDLVAKTLTFTHAG